MPLPDFRAFSAALSRVTPRAWMRTGFFVFFLWCSWRLWAFYQWALGQGEWVARPEATAGLVPLGGLMSLSAWMKSGTFDDVMPAAVVIILGAVVLSALFKRGFCGWVCPVGSTVAFFAWIGRALRGGGHLPVHKVADRVLRAPKYLVGAMVLASVLSISVETALEFQLLPYYATSDLKILYGLLNPAWGYWVLAGGVVVTSALWGNTWCRYMCPLGALYGAIGVLSLGTVRREPALCIDCARCDTACHARIEVAKARTVRSPECDGCQDCVRACPKPGALSSRFAGMSVPWVFWPVFLLITWMLVYAVALGTGNWTHGLPDEQVAAYMRTMKLSHDWGEQ